MKILISYERFRLRKYTYKALIICSLFSSWLALGVDGASDFFSLTGVPLTPISRYPSGSAQFFSGNFITLKSVSLKSHRLKSASPRTPLPLSTVTVNFDILALLGLPSESTSMTVLIWNFSSMTAELMVSLRSLLFVLAFFYPKHTNNNEYLFFINLQASPLLTSLPDYVDGCVLSDLDRE